MRITGNVSKKAGIRRIDKDNVPISKMNQPIEIMPSPSSIGPEGEISHLWKGYSLYNHKALTSLALVPKLYLRKYYCSKPD
jgi:hypothetical protein